MLKITFKIFTYIVVLLLIGFVIKPMPEFVKSEPRQLPWSLSSNSAHTNYQYLDNGQILIEITLGPLINISPEMLHWFYQNLPISTVQIEQKTISWYHLFHPSEHNVIEVLKPTSNNTYVIGAGALIQKKEWFGSYYNQGTERIIMLSEQGMTLNLELAGMTFGKVEHLFTQTPDGTQYKLRSIIGSDLPVMGPIINLIIRYKMFPESMLKNWIRHQVEEISSLNAFLPQLYTASKQDTHYLLELPNEP